MVTAWSWVTARFVSPTVNRKYPSVMVVKTRFTKVIHRLFAEKSMPFSVYIHRKSTVLPVTVI